MEVEFDPEKSAANEAERGFSFALAPIVLENLLGQFEDTRHPYGEVRMVAFGTVEGRLFCCVYTMRDEVVRVISLRKANQKEVGAWLT